MDIATPTIDLFILRTRHTRWEFPSGAVLTALIVSMVLSAQTPWYVVSLTSALAVVSKYVVRTRAGNVFNPAALAMVATFPIFHAGQSWWGALPECHRRSRWHSSLAGVFIADRVNRMPVVLTFLAAYLGSSHCTAFVGDPVGVSEVFRAPDLQAVLFFALFILTDPPTSPVRYRDQVIFATIVALTSYVIFERIGRCLLFAGWSARRQPMGSMASRSAAHAPDVSNRRPRLRPRSQSLAGATMSPAVCGVVLWQQPLLCRERRPGLPSAGTFVRHAGTSPSCRTPSSKPRSSC